MLIFVVALLIVVPVLLADLAAFLAKVPEYASKLQALACTIRQPRCWSGSAERFAVPDLQNSLGDVREPGRNLARRPPDVDLVRGQALLGVLSLVVVTPVVAFYLLVDWDHMIEQGGQLGSAAPSRDGSRAGPRDQRRDRRLHPRAGLVCLILGHMVCRWA